MLPRVLSQVFGNRELCFQRTLLHTSPVWEKKGASLLKGPAQVFEQSVVSARTAEGTGRMEWQSEKQRQGKGKEVGGADSLLRVSPAFHTCPGSGARVHPQALRHFTLHWGFQLSRNCSQAKWHFYVYFKLMKPDWLSISKMSPTLQETLNF